MYTSQNKSNLAECITSVIVAVFLILILTSLTSSIAINLLSTQKALGQPTSEHPLPSVTKNTSASSSGKTLTYKNSTYGITIKYPSNWSHQGLLTTPGSGTVYVVEINPPLAADPNAATFVDVLIGPGVSKLPLDQLARNVIQNFRTGNYSDFKLLSAKTDSTLAGKPAYSVVFTFTDTNGLHTKQMEKGTVIGDSLYAIDFVTEASKYNTFFPAVQNIMNSFTVNPQNLNSTSP
jgi:hypothetical protein